MPTQEALKALLRPYTPYSKELVLEAISTCESGGDMKAKNASSTASGEFQFIKKSWQDYGKMLWGNEWIKKDVLSKDNYELASFVYDINGTKDWKESEWCWSKLLTSS